MTAQDTIRAAYEAARSGAVLVDRSSEGRLEVLGADRISWLQGLLTNDVAALAPGHGCYAAHLTPQGRMVTDLRVLVRDESVWLDVPGQVKDALRARLDAFVISEDVELRDLTGSVSRSTVCGPTAAAVVAAALVPAGEHRTACARALEALAEHAHLERPWRGHELVVASTREVGLAGFDVYVAAGEREALWSALAGAGAVAIGEPAWEVLRVEAGRPRFGTDMDADTIPLEAGLDEGAISFTKGCYIGQEVIVRVRDRGHGRVAKRLVALAETVPSGGPAPAFAAGDPVVAGDDEVGRVTSAAWSQGEGRTLALGYVLRAHAEPGTRLRVRGRGGDVEVELARAGGGRPVADADGPVSPGAADERP